jgi:DNA-binding transcriptional MocR family regulator
MKKILYQNIATGLAEKIENGILKIGDKMPSLRIIHQEHGVSMNTAVQAYLELERRGLIVSRPQSGFYVTFDPTGLPIPSMSKPQDSYEPECVESLITKMYSSLNTKQVTKFSMGVPDNRLLPIAKLNKELVDAMRNLDGGGTQYEPVQGNVKLRQDIARLTYTWSGNMKSDDIVTTAGAMNAVSFALMALTQRGDSIAVESPVYFGTLQLAKNLGLKVIELPTHPLTGIELEALRKVLSVIKVCILVANFSNPLGSLMPEEHKREVVYMLAKHGIPLIEDDLYGDLFYGNSRPKPCKAFDNEGLVLWIGSVSKTLAPGYRVGWIAPGIFKEKIIHQKLIHSFSTTAITHEAVANFLEKGRYEHHLRKLRNELQANCLHFSRAINRYFPADTMISRPQGGFMLWVQLNPKVDTTELYHRLIRQKISIAPGRMFSLQEQFANCMRLSYGQQWSDKIENGLKLLGKTVKSML